MTQEGLGVSPVFPISGNYLTPKFTPYNFFMISFAPAISPLLMASTAACLFSSGIFRISEITDLGAFTVPDMIESLKPGDSFSAASTAFEKSASRRIVRPSTPYSFPIRPAVPSFTSRRFKRTFCPLENSSDLLSPPCDIFSASYCFPRR